MVRLFSNKITVAGLCFTTVCASFIPFKLNYLVGSLASFFSVTNVMTPLIGLFGGSTFCIILFFVRMFVLSTRYTWAHMLVHCVPGLCAGLSFSLPGYIMKLMLPVACIIFFVIHPVGSHAMVYTLYWFIPILSYFFPKKNIFIDFLSATFIAHAVGSVLWLYTVPTMTAALWIGLIPIVFVERVLFTLGTVFVYHVCFKLHTINSGRSCYQLQSMSLSGNTRGE